MESIEVNWAEIKAFADARSVSVQWVDVNGRYWLKTIDGNFSLSSNIFKTSPASEDQADFEANYKANGNKAVGFSNSGSLSDSSGSTSVTANTSTLLMAANLNRKYLFIQNIDDASIWINFGGAANNTPGNILITGGGSFVLEGSAITTQSIYVFSEGKSIPYTAKEK